MTLTVIQRTTLDAIRRLTVKGVPPSWGELMLALGLRTKSAVHQRLVALRSRGLVAWKERVPRSLSIVEDAISPVVLEGMTNVALRRTAAHIAGVLAMREGGAGLETAAAYRRIADRVSNQPGGAHG